MLCGQHAEAQSAQHGNQQCGTAGHQGDGQRVGEQCTDPVIGILEAGSKIAMAQVAQPRQILLPDGLIEPVLRIQCGEHLIRHAAFGIERPAGSQSQQHET